MKRIAKELLRVAEDILPATRAVLTIPRSAEIDSYAYNDVHFEVQRFLDRVRKNEGIEAFMLRRDDNEKMALEIGFGEHEAAPAIVRELVVKARRMCDRCGVPDLSIGVDENTQPLIVEALGLVKAAHEVIGSQVDGDAIMASDPLSSRIWAAFKEMGVIPEGPIAGPIRWQAVFFIGPAGSGKSFVRNMKYMRHLDFKVVDPDEIKKLHPDYDPEAPFKVHKWSKAKSEARFKQLVTGGDGTPVIVDGTGRNAEGILNKMRVAKANGYRTYVVYVYVPFEISIFRNRNRDRFVPEDVIIEQSEKISHNFNTLKGKADKSKVIPNFGQKELGLAKKDIAVYPVPQAERPPRPGDADYGMAKAASRR